MMTFEKPDKIKFALRTFTEEEIDALLERGPAHLGALVVKAWVAWMEGRQVTALKWTSVGPTAQTFPTHIYESQA